MSRRRRAAARLIVVSLVCGTPANRLEAQQAPTVHLGISALESDSTSPAPNMLVTAFEDLATFAPFSISLELSLESQFRTPFYVKKADAETALFTIDTLLTEHEIVFFRTRLIDRFGSVVAEAREQHPVRSWLRLVDPASPIVNQLTTRTPRFVWNSPAITVPPGLWVYDVTVINRDTNLPEPGFTRTNVQATIVRATPSSLDLSFTFPDSLQTNTSYRWQVTARAQNGSPSNSTTVTSPASFTIPSLDHPVTIFYQNFPNPFGRGERLGLTCFWFDLADSSVVTLTIYDARLRPVRRIIPNNVYSGKLPARSYGREDPNKQTGCDDTVAWNGKDDTGRFVPAGLYYAVFKGDHVSTSRKILFRGP